MLVKWRSWAAPQGLGKHFGPGQAREQHESKGRAPQRTGQRVLGAACSSLRARSPPAAPQQLSLPLLPFPLWLRAFFKVRFNKTLEEKAFEKVF